MYFDKFDLICLSYFLYSIFLLFSTDVRITTILHVSSVIVMLVVRTNILRPFPSPSGHLISFSAMWTRSRMFWNLLSCGSTKTIRLELSYVNSSLVWSVQASTKICDVEHTLYWALIELKYDLFNTSSTIIEYIKFDSHYTLLLLNKTLN